MRTFLLCFALFIVGLAACADTPKIQPLRIGLDHEFLHSTLLLISSDLPFSLKDVSTGRILAQGAAGTVYKMTPGGMGVALAQAMPLKDRAVSGQPEALSAAPVGVGILKIARLDNKPLTSRIVWHHYRGLLSIRRDPDNTLRVINTVPLETYLYGVIPAEIGTRVPLEAMKAQAVAARTYALKNRGKCSAQGFDLDNTTHCEGYLGMDGETALTNASVDDTRGQVLTYDGQLIDAPYSTDSGGMTACDTNGDCPYLQAVRDANPGDGIDYAADGAYHKWTISLTPEQLQQRLSKNARTQVVRFMSLGINGYDSSGRITTATVAGVDGTMKTVTGPELRQILGYDFLRSTRVTLAVMPDGDYKFDGMGWGHGLGMSQLGAAAMASPAYHKTYTEILNHYYVGVKLASDAAMVSEMPMTRTAARRGF